VGVSIQYKVGQPSKKKPPKLAKAPSEKFTKIKSLSVEHRTMLHTLFYERRTLVEISKIFREDLGLWNDVGEAATKHMLRQYKRLVIDKNLIVLPPTGTPLDNHHLETIEDLKDKIDIAEELAHLVATQKTRVQKMLYREQNLPFLFNNLRSEMQALAGFVKDFAEVAFDLGLRKRVPVRTKITTPGGQVTEVESEGREFVQFSVQNHQQLEDAASEFFKIIEASFREVPQDESSPST
jgi:hypothetical protein